MTTDHDSRQLRRRLTPGLLAVCLAAPALSGCVDGYGPPYWPERPVYTPRQQPPPRAPRADLQPALNTIDSRIRSYEARLDEVAAIENRPDSMMIPQDRMARLGVCKSQLLDILTGYDSLRKQLLTESNLDRAQNLASGALQQLNQQDMAYLEGDCNRLTADLKSGRAAAASPTPPEQPSPDPYPPATPDQPQATPAPAAPAYAAPDTRIQAAFAAGDYPEVIRLYNENWTDPARQPALSTSLQYGQALLKNNQVEEDQSVLGVLAEREGQGDDATAAEARRLLGDIDFSTINYRSAQRHYGNLSRTPAGRNDSWAQLHQAVLQQQSASPEELAAYSALLRKYLAYNPNRDGSTVAEEAERFLHTYPASRLVANVNEMIQRTGGPAPGPAPSPEGPPSGGPASAGPDAPPDPEAAANAPLTPEQFAARDQALREQFDKAQSQMDAKDYDNAIQTWSSLLGTSYDEQARQKVLDTTRLAAEDKRRRAADLFVGASQTRDREQRKNMLLESRGLLRDIQTRYPQAGLGEKVTRNLNSVEEALRAIDPALVEDGGGAAVPAGPPVRQTPL